MLVLGIGGFLHDYNCALLDLRRGRVALREAERRSRRKHHVPRPGDPDLLLSVLLCCRDLGVPLRSVDTVVFAHGDGFPVADCLRRLLGPRKEYVAVDHHLAHAAVAFFTSGLSSAAVVSLDGFGDGASGLIAHGEGRKLTPLTRIRDADSIGLEYTRATWHLGLGGHGAEGKTQGLAAYGEPTLFDDYMQEIEIRPDGGLRLGATLRGATSRLARGGAYLDAALLDSDFLARRGPRRIAPEPLTGFHRDLAASIQAVLESVALDVCRAARSRTGERHLCLGGGVAMNSSLNGRLAASGAFDTVYPVPMASDRGTGLGAALYHPHHVLGVARWMTLHRPFFGGAISNRSAARTMRRAGLRVCRTSDPEGQVIDALAGGEVVAWVQGRSEAGARALGHRSLLADPRSVAMREHINARVKHREAFRPLAPSVLSEAAGEYFELPAGADLGHMTFTVRSTARARAEIPAAIHVDGTARAHTVRADRDPCFARLLRRFARRTGVPALINTSFNDRGEPIVESAGDAVRTFFATAVDLLCIGDVVGRRP